MHRPGAGRTAGSRAPSLEETFYPFVLRRQDSYTAVGPEGERPPSPGDRSLAPRPQPAQDTWERERELQLAAELGKALLERNEELGRERERETREWAQRLEDLEQEKHVQRRKFEARESEWQACLVELEAELAQRSGQWQRERQQEQRSRDETVLHLVTQNQRLLDELSEADTEKDRLSSQLQELKDRLCETSLSQAEQQNQLQVLHEETQRLVEGKAELEQKLQGMAVEKEILQSAVDTLQDSLALLQQQKRVQEQELARVQNELDHVRTVNQELRQSLREMEQHTDLKDLGKLNDSLHSEIQQIINFTYKAETQEEVPVLLGSVDTSSRLKSDSSSPDDSCRSGQLPSRRAVSRQHEASLNEKEDTIQRLNEQVRYQAIEVTALREELSALRKMALTEDGDERLQQAIAGRDRAISRKNEMELKLERGRIERDTLNHQLLRTIEQKIELVQQLEDWQEDMRVVIGQQLRSQQQQQEGRTASASSPEKGRVASARQSGGLFLRFRKR